MMSLTSSYLSQIHILQFHQICPMELNVCQFDIRMVVLQHTSYLRTGIMSRNMVQSPTLTD